jgi:hypothetical protein
MARAYGTLCEGCASLINELKPIATRWNELRLWSILQRNFYNSLWRESKDLKQSMKSHFIENSIIPCFPYIVYDENIVS